ncbi:Eco57I restriction-modification methylase domain-containing protein [Lutispora thermophila]|uniref:site-specific DNA-methyltransferase (adenine-specific) n=1 Tax=Lutispora thermophila DSM 19022 TaxID=1122184 RepID=A0A1M6IYN2_9FIRM|nr:N-6 DNA methylase [Lutispora thermophila]SHJ39492.1 N-6 DNA Methylase [Lutispora thermophila DSM 19022]
MKEFIPGKLYQQSMEKDSKKANGRFYTPDYIIDFMLARVFSNVNIIENPFIKILDPACGCGFFLIKAYDLLKEMLKSNLEKIREKYSDETYETNKDGYVIKINGKQYWQEKNLHYHILKNCLYGADTDKEALGLCSASLLAKDNNDYKDELNLVCGDSLFRWEKYYCREQLVDELENYKLIYDIKNSRDHTVEHVTRDRLKEILRNNMFWSNKFDYIIGNPPYVGHKELNMEYKKWLLDEYNETFKDKSDLSYCFYQRALEVAEDKGIIGFVSSRYFMESPTGRNLRRYLKNNSRINNIVDFYGETIFPGVGVAAAIFFISNEVDNNNEIEVWKYQGNGFNKLEHKDFQIFKINQDSITEDRWILIPNEERRILEKIENGCTKRLGDMAESFQGIITGCDKAFIIDNDTIKTLGIEAELIKPWIKNSHVDRYRVRNSNLKLIYSDLIDDPSRYPNSIMHIEKYKQRLENRRECKKGLRLWYQLQWGRKTELFTKEKIVFPYKSTCNRFALDRRGCFCSADVYSFILKDGVGCCSLPFLLGVLNSRLYEFYFKLFAKKMGKDIYDYYPNTVMDLKIPDYKACKDIEAISLELIRLYEEDADSKRISILEKEIDDILRSYFSIRKEALSLK